MFLPIVIASSRRRSIESFDLLLTGLTSGEARIGDHASIGFTATQDGSPITLDSWTWGTENDDDTYGVGGDSPDDYTAGDGGNLVLSGNYQGETVYAFSPIRYAPGSLSIDNQSAWTVDDTSVNLDASASGANLTFSYAASGLPAGLSINASSGAITGTPTGASSGTATVTATDQYGRELTDNFTWSAVLRTQATAANGLSDPDWTVDDDTVNINAASDFTANGNDLTYVITGLPAGLVDDGDGTISGTPTVDGQSGTVTITGTDEYDRETVSTFTFTTSYRSQATAAGGLSDAGWTVDDDTVNIDCTSDFTANGNDLTYVITGLPSGLVDDGDGTISGTPDTDGESGTVTITATDEYGRETVSAFTFTTSYRSQATAAGALEDQTFVSGNGVQTYDASGDFTTNGNDLTFSVNSVTGVTIDGATGVVSFDTDAMTEQTGTSIVVTATDEYDRETTSGFSLDITASSLEITAEPDGTISVTWEGTLDEITVSGGTDFDGSYTAFHDGTALIDTHLDGVAGRALAILDTTGTGEVGQTLTAGDILALYEDGQDEPTVSIQWQRDGVDIAGATGSTYTLVAADAETDVRPTFEIAASGVTTVTENGSAVSVSAVAPDAFVDADWSVATGSGSGELDVTIASLPSDGGATITDVEYELDASGTWTSSGGTTDFTITGLTASTSYDVRLRAVNSVGNSAAGNTESATSGGASAYSFTDSFDDAGTYTAGNEIPDDSADWSYFEGGATVLAVTSNPLGEAVIGGATAFGTVGIFHEDGGSLANDQYAEVTIDAYGAASNFFVIVRGSDTDNYIQFGWHDGNGEYLLRERSGGSNTNYTAAGSRPGPGDRLRLEVSGTTATAKVDSGSGFTTIFTETISIASGKIGLRGFFNNNTVDISSFEGGDL